MTVYSFHLVQTNLITMAKALCRPPTASKVAGLKHAECMAKMVLGAPILSPKRMRFQQLIMFAAWESENAIDEFLSTTKLGCVLTTGWHVRMELQRRWGHITEFDDLPSVEEQDPEAPVVSVTLARMKLSQIARFIHWGKPVEKLVRDHSGTTISLAAMRPLRTVSTFSVWNSQREMLEMVHGRSPMYKPDRHAVAMVERERKGFHSEFTTLRFKAIAEFGSWQGRTNIIPR